MGLNMIRLWGGAGVPYEAFYNACDEAGVLGNAKNNFLSLFLSLLE